VLSDVCSAISEPCQFAVLEAQPWPRYTHCDIKSVGKRRNLFFICTKVLSFTSPHSFFFFSFSFTFLSSFHYTYAFAMSESYPGVTAPLSLATSSPQDIRLTASLEETLERFGMYDSEQRMVER